MSVRWAVAGAVALGGVTLGGLGLGIARRLTTPVGGRTYDLTIRGVDDSGERAIVALDRTPQTAAPGRYCLLLENGGWVQLSSDVEDLGPGRVGRGVLGEPRAGLRVGERASWSGIYFSSPEAVGLEASDVDDECRPGSRLAHSPSSWLIDNLGHPHSRSRKPPCRNAPRSAGRRRDRTHLACGDLSE